MSPSSYCNMPRIKKPEPSHRGQPVMLEILLLIAALSVLFGEVEACGGHFHRIFASSHDPWPNVDVIPAQLLNEQILGNAPPEVVCVSSLSLYQNTRILRARHLCEPWATPTLNSELERANRLSGRATRDIVLYCGCCEFKTCPNIRRAYVSLTGLTTRKIKVLFLPVNLRDDWIDKGFASEGTQL